MQPLLSFLAPHSSVDGAASLVPAGYAWTRPLFFDDVFVAAAPSAAERLLTSKKNILSRPAAWPLVVMLSGIVSTIASPSSTKLSAMLATEALVSLTQNPMFADNSQPVFYDLLSGAFVSLGGAVALTGFLGRFGNAENALKETALSYTSYLFNRGSSRSAFWQQ